MIEEKAEICLKEVSNGIYFSIKGPNKNTYVNSETIVKLLNSKRKVYVIGASYFYSNFEV